MYVLVAILFMGQSYKIETSPILFPSLEECKTVKDIVLEELMATKPTPSAYAIAFCAAVPTEV